MGTHPGPVEPARREGLAILVLASHRLVAESLARMLPQLDEVRSAQFATSRSEAHLVLRRTPFDVVLADEAFEGEPVVEVVARAKSRWRPATLVFASTSSPHRTVKALLGGAAGWIAEDCLVEELADALAALQQGKRWVSPRLRSDVIEVLVHRIGTDVQSGPSIRLSPRQLDVLGCLMNGMSHGEAAEALQLSLTTIRTHVQHMCRQLGVHSTPALVAAARHGQLAVPVQHGGRRPR